LNPVKLAVIDHCFEQQGCRSFADLGGVWGVDGGYSRYAADVHRAERGVLVDDDFTAAYLEHSSRLPNLVHVRGNFGAPEITEALGSLDVVFFFDVLLHQVNPDWDELLARYAERARCVAVVQPQWNGEETVRLLDLGEVEYLAAVPPDDIYEGLFSRLDTVHETRSRPWRDVHDIWQWGITDRDLTERMRAHGFEVTYFRETGPWRGLPRFHESAFVFARAAA
jgi:hypothetical protein